MLDWIAVVFFGVLFLTQVWTFPRNFRLYRTAHQYHTIDVSHEGHIVPDIATGAVIELQGLGFNYIGTLATFFKEPDDRIISWVFHDPERTTVAALVLLKPPVGTVLVNFSSFFYDNACLDITYPHGENLDYPDYRSRRVKAGIIAAYRVHKEHLAEYVYLHGRPIPQQSILDILKLGAIYREHHAKRKLWPVLVRHFCQLLGLGSGTILAFVYTLNIFSSPIEKVAVGAGILASLSYPIYLQIRISSHQQSDLFSEKVEQ